MKRLLTLLSGLVVASALLGSIASTSGAADVRHSGTNWTWKGPASWDAVYGTYGITISSPKQDRFVDIGFAATQCSKAGSKAKSAEKYFNAKRKSSSATGARFTEVGKVLKVGKSYRQTSRFKAKQDGRSFKGEFVLGYGFIDATNCNTSQVSLVAPARKFDKSLKQLEKIYKSAKYSGPGDPTP